LSVCLTPLREISLVLSRRSPIKKANKSNSSAYVLNNICLTSFLEDTENGYQRF
jgi:hypothetical protein